MRLSIVVFILWFAIFSVRSSVAFDDVADTAKKRMPEKAVQEAVKKLRVGMSFQKAEEHLKPVLLATGWASYGGTGAGVHCYHLRGGWQISLENAAFPNLKTVSSIGKLEPKKPWRGLFWTPSAADKAAAARIATAALRDELKARRDPKAKFPTNPAGMLVSDDKLSAELEVTPGNKTRFVVSAAEGRWQTHKVISVNFLEKETWRFQVVVDLDDGKAVPSQWTPTEQNIAKARAVADRSISKFLGKTQEERAKVKVEGWGRYDYGPLRRILVLCYTKPSGGGRLSLEFVDIDFEKMKLAED